MTALRPYLRVARRGLWILIAFPVLASGIAYAWTAHQPKVYQSQASILVRPAQPLGGPEGTAYYTTDQIENTYGRWLTSTPVLEKVATDTGLPVTAGDIAGGIKVVPDRNSLVLDVTVQNSNPQYASRIASVLVSDFIDIVKTAQRDETGTVPNARSADNLILLSPPSAAGGPVAPQPLRSAGYAFFAGLLAAIAVLYALEYLDQTIREDDGLAARTGLLSLGSIPLASAGPGADGELVAVVGDSGVAEAYKSLRTNLLFSTIDGEAGKVVVITSPLPSEGKSRTAANLAVVLAHAGYSTVLLDADFRRPGQHRIFGCERENGLSSIILRNRRDDCVFNIMPNLDLVPSGPRPPNPSELLGSQRMIELLGDLARDYDYVLLDTPPINAFTDSSVLAAHATGTVLVAAHGGTTFPALERARQNLERVGAKVLGLVMNKVPRGETDYYYYPYEPRAKSSKPAMAEAAGRV